MLKVIPTITSPTVYSLSRSSLYLMHITFTFLRIMRNEWMRLPQFNPIVDLFFSNNSVWRCRLFVLFPNNRRGHTHVLWRACIHNTRDCFMSLTSCFLTNQWASVHSTLSIPCPMKWRVFVTALWRHLRGRLPSNSKLDEVLSNIFRKPAAFIVDLLHCETPLLYVVPICIYSIHVRWVTFHESTCRSLKHVLFLELFIFSCQFDVKLRENLSRRYHSVIGCT